MPTLVRHRPPRPQRRRVLPALLGTAAGGSSLVGSIDAVSDWTSDITFVPLAISSDLSAVSTWTGTESYPAPTTSLSGILSGSASFGASLSTTFVATSILAAIDAALASLVTVRAEKVAELEAARGGPRGPLDLASSDLAYVDQVVRELNHARAQVVAYDVIA